MLAAGLVACGGSSEEEAAPDAFVTEADAVCTRYGPESATLENEFNRALRQGDLATSAAELDNQADRVTAMLNELDALQPPVSDQTLMDDWLALGRQRIQLAGTASDAIAAGDEAAMIEAGRQGMDLSAEFGRLAEQLGFEVCGTGAPPPKQLNRTGTTTP